MKNKTEVYLPPKVRQLLIAGLQNETITTDDLAVIAHILSYAETPEETELFFAGLAEMYPLFQDYEAYQDGLSHISFEQQVKTLIPKLIQSDPALATKVMKAAQETGMTMEKLKQRFPQLNHVTKTKNL